MCDVVTVLETHNKQPEDSLQQNRYVYLLSAVMTPRVAHPVQFLIQEVLYKPCDKTVLPVCKITQSQRQHGWRGLPLQQGSTVPWPWGVQWWGCGELMLGVSVLQAQLHGATQTQHVCEEGSPPTTAPRPLGADPAVCWTYALTGAPSWSCCAREGSRSRNQSKKEKTKAISIE